MKAVTMKTGSIDRLKCGKMRRGNGKKQGRGFGVVNAERPTMIL